MDSISLVLGGLFSTWVGWWFYARKRGWSQTIAIGGGFIAAMLFVLVCMYAGKLYSKLGTEELPATLHEAGIKGKDQWSDAEYNLAAKILLKDIGQTEYQLDDAVQRGDRAKMVDIILAFNDRVGEWPSTYGQAPNSPVHQLEEKWRSCRLTMLYFMQYAKDGTGKDYMLNNRKACQRLSY